MRNSLLSVLAIILFSCVQNYVPKPHSYFRIDFPDREYRLFDSNCPFTFEYPVYGNLEPYNRRALEPYFCWFDINFPKYKGTIHLTYKEIDKNFDGFIEDNWRIIYSRLAQRADAIDEIMYIDHGSKVYGTLYDIRGDAASAVQFWVTDSVKNFVRGSLYFTVRPNHDSLAPVVNFLREDIVHLMESIQWKSN